MIALLFLLLLLHELYRFIADTIFALNGFSGHFKQPLRVFALNPAEDELFYSFGPTIQPFTQPHALALSQDCLDVFVGEIGPDKAWKFQISFTNRNCEIRSYFLE